MSRILDALAGLVAAHRAIISESGYAWIVTSETIPGGTFQTAANAQHHVMSWAEQECREGRSSVVAVTWVPSTRVGQAVVSVLRASPNRARHPVARKEMRS